MINSTTVVTFCVERNQVLEVFASVSRLILENFAQFMTGNLSNPRTERVSRAQLFMTFELNYISHVHTIKLRNLFKSLKKLIMLTSREQTITSSSTIRRSRYPLTSRAHREREQASPNSIIQPTYRDNTRWCSVWSSQIFCSHSELLRKSNFDHEYFMTI